MAGTSQSTTPTGNIHAGIRPWPGRTDRQGVPRGTKFPPGFYPHGQNDWVDAIKKLHKQGDIVFACDLQDKHPYLYDQGVWIFGDWDTALQAAGFDPDKMRLQGSWDRQKINKKLHMRDRNLAQLRVKKSHGTIF